MLVPILVSLFAIATGLFVSLRPKLVIELQRRFYEKINWRIEPISMPKEIRNTRIMGIFLVAITIITLIYLCFARHNPLFVPRSVFAADAKDRAFNDYINDATGGTSFEEPVALPDICDFRKCKDQDCLLEVFDKTILAQELQYVTIHYGLKGRDWDVTGFDRVESYVFNQDKFYDDLGIEIMATGKNKTLHFDITASCNQLNRKQFELSTWEMVPDRKGEIAH